MSDLENMLDENEPLPEVDAPEVEETEAEKPAEVEAAPEAEAPEAQSEAEEEQPEAEPEADKETPQQMVPLAALHEARERERQAAAKLAEWEQKQLLAQKEPVKAPDFIDPEAAQYFEARLQERNEEFALQLSNITATISERNARSVHGAETVDAALEAAERAGVIDHFRGRGDPWGDLVAWHERGQVDQALQGRKLKEYEAQIRQEAVEQYKAEQLAKQVAQPAPSAAPSLAQSTNLGARNGRVETVPDSLEAFFNS